MSDPHNDFDRYDSAMQARFTEGREQGRREGREEVYALVRQLPEGPYRGDLYGYRECVFCEAYSDEKHKEGCLWAAAHASTGSQEPTT